MNKPPQKERQNQSNIYRMEADLYVCREWIEKDIKNLNMTRECHLSSWEGSLRLPPKKYKSIKDKIRYRKKRIQIINNELSWLEFCFNADLNPKNGKIV